MSGKAIMIEYDTGFEKEALGAHRKGLNLNLKDWVSHFFGHLILVSQAIDSHLLL